MSKKFILIAEDEIAYGKILQNILEKEGYEVAVSVNGEDFLKVAYERNPALVLLDLVMPVKNGFEVLTEMRNDEKLKHIQVIALSNLGQEEEFEKAKKLGISDFLIKSDERLYDLVYKIKKLLQ
jgi:chemosensory pili system protein ChpA (sensor histidine kinase/response regulator)